MSAYKIFSHFIKLHNTLNIKLIIYFCRQSHRTVDNLYCFAQKEEALTTKFNFWKIFRKAHSFIPAITHFSTFPKPPRSNDIWRKKLIKNLCFPHLIYSELNFFLFTISFSFFMFDIVICWSMTGKRILLESDFVYSILILFLLCELLFKRKNLKWRKWKFCLLWGESDVQRRFWLNYKDFWGLNSRNHRI